MSSSASHEIPALAWAAIAASLAAFAVLSAVLFAADLTGWDIELVKESAQLRGPAATTAIRAATYLGSMAVVGPLAAVAAGVALLHRHRRAALFVALAAAGASLLQALVKHAFDRARPPVAQQLASPLGSSYPSGHALQSAALALAVAVLLWHTRWRIPAIVGGAGYVLLVGFTRVYLGVHYPGDVLAGWLLAVALVAALYLILRPLAGRKDRV